MTLLICPCWAVNLCTSLACFFWVSHLLAVVGRLLPQQGGQLPLTYVPPSMQLHGSFSKTLSLQQWLLGPHALPASFAPCLPCSLRYCPISDVKDCCNHHECWGSKAGAVLGTASAWATFWACLFGFGGTGCCALHTWLLSAKHVPCTSV